MKPRTVTLSIVGALLLAAFSRPARADWTGHLDAGGGWSSARGGAGELTARIDGVMLSFAHDKAGIGPAVEMHMLAAKAGLGLVAVWRDDNAMSTPALTSTLVYGYDASDSSGAYLAGTVAVGYRVTDSRSGGWAPSSAVYLSVCQRLDGSDNQIVLGLQVGLGFTYMLLGSFAH
jgi:hypothetical protein